MQKNIQVMALPKYFDLKEVTHAHLSQLNECYELNHLALGKEIEKWRSKIGLDNQAPPLRTIDLIHPLSIHIPRTAFKSGASTRTSDEMAILEDLYSGAVAQALPSDYPHFEHLILSLGKAISGTPGFRDGAVGTRVDSNGNWVLFPHYTHVRPQLKRIQAFIKSNFHRDCIFTAIVVHNAIGNIHPFFDGNGRLSRILFNHIVRCKYPNWGYYPIFDISAISRFGMVLRMRQAQYHSNWAPLIKFYRDATLPFLSRVEVDAATK